MTRTVIERDTSAVITIGWGIWRGGRWDIGGLGENATEG